MKKLRTIFLSALFIFGLASPVLALAAPQVASVSAKDCEARVLGIPPWYRGLTNNNGSTCDLKGPNDVGGIGNYIWKIVLNGIEMAIVIAAYVTIFFILYGGFLFITGGDKPGQVEKARTTILNAVIGLIIAMAAIALTNLIFSIIK